jgi:hypothetical protein
VKIVILPPGTDVVWRHFMIDGRVIERSGQVVDAAPVIESGPQVVRWVIPYEPLTTDLYSILAVAKAASYSPAHGRYLENARWGDQYAERGQLFSSNYAGSPTGALAMRAARAAWDVRNGLR